MHVDVRIIAATNSNLYESTKDGRFREDLYYRLNVISILLPPLRERMEDVALLADHFIQKYCKENEKPPLYLTPQVLNALMDYSWPGNVRELENVIERAVVLSRADSITMPIARNDSKGSQTVHACRSQSSVQGKSRSIPEAAHFRCLTKIEWGSKRGSQAAPHQAHDPQRNDQAIQHQNPRLALRNDVPNPH